MTNKNQVLIKTPQFKRGLKSVLETRLVQTDLGILLAGEPAFETDTGQLKIGNGKDPYKDLPYVGGVSQEYLNKINQNAVDIKSIDSRLSVLEAIKHHEHENKSVAYTICSDAEVAAIVSQLLVDEECYQTCRGVHQEWSHADGK